MTVHFTCADPGGSGIPTGACPADQTLSTEGAAVASTSQTVTDAAGNTSDASNVVTVKIDKIPPALAPVVTPNPVVVGGSASADPHATDGLSGINTASCDIPNTRTVGDHTLTCSATDIAGNTNTAVVHYVVLYGFGGFLTPLPFETLKQSGYTLAIKFRRSACVAGFETTLFLQALTLEAGAWTVLQGVLIGFAAVVAVFFLVVSLERRLPHKKMLIVTGVMITWVLVVLVGQTIQVMQKVGWIPVTPIEGLELPYWSGVWLGLYPTWEGLIAQFAAATFVVGSYFGAETLRRRKRSRILIAPAESQEPLAPATSAHRAATPR